MNTRDNTSRSFLGGLSIGVRIGGLTGLGGLAILAVLGLSLWGNKALESADHLAKSFEALSDLNAQLSIAALELRRHEKDFLLRRAVQYAERNAKTLEAMTGQLAKLAGLEAAAPIRPRIDDITAGLGRYKSQFGLVVSGSVAMGLTDELGKRGELRKAVHQVEEIVKAAQQEAFLIPMLTMRRYEKDFLLRGDPAYVERLKAVHNEMRVGVATANLPSERKTEIGRLLGDYARAMDEVATQDKVVRDATKAMSDAYAAIEPSFKKIEDFAAERQKAVEAEIEAIRARVARLGMLIGLAVLALFGVGAVLISRSVTRPVQAITGIMRKLAEGERALDVPFTANADEVGAMARAVEVFKENMIKAERLDAEAKAAQQHDIRRAEKRQALTEAFDKIVVAALTKVNETVKAVHTTSDGLHAAADQTSKQSATVAAASQQASANVQTVATATDELGASTREIGQRVSETTRISREAVSGVEKAGSLMQGLASAADQIGAVVKLINDIASQTNLLALNATIEAARAGDAGKGFAVVANEVKNLATQTTKATDEIAGQVGGVQNATREAEEAIRAVVEQIRKVDEVVGAIAAAVEEQGAATQEIARNAQEAANGNEAVNQTIVQVSQAAQDTGSMAAKMFGVANDLQTEADGLKTEVERFLDGMRAV
ncbi:MAG: HAMP domain-containing protein [Rhodospirillales bacterium]|nr:HAMP domain-containing protein [Rhodospirillales bacterium]